MIGGPIPELSVNYALNKRYNMLNKKVQVEDEKRALAAASTPVDRP